MAERWTPETEEAVASAVHAARCGCTDSGVRASDAVAANAALRYLADAGLLVTPQTRAVLDAAEAMVVDWDAGRGTPTRIRAFRDAVYAVGCGA